MSQRPDPFDLTGRTAFITGGSTGIGYAISAGLAARGARVLVGARTQSAVDEAVQKLDALSPIDHDDDHPVAAGVTLDVTNGDSVRHAVHKAMNVFGGLDIAVHAAGQMGKADAFDCSAELMHGLYDTHVVGGLRVAQAAGHVFREQHRGVIINVVSITSFVGLTGVTAYAAAKHGLLGLTKQLAVEWAPHGIRVNAIAPGFVPTDLNRSMIEGTDRGRRILESTPMERFGTADEIAGAAVYLASDAASFVNGVTIPVDGGYLANGISEATAPWTRE